VGRVKRAFACESTFRHQLQFYFCSTTAWATHDQYHHCICFCSSHTDSIKGSYILSVFSFLEALFMLNGRGHKHGQRLSVKLLLSELCSLSPLRFHLNRASSREHIRISSSGCPLLLQKENKPFGSRILYSIEHYCSPRTCSLLPVAIFFFYIEAAALFVDRAASRGQFPDLLMPIRIVGMLRLSLPLLLSRFTVHSKLKPLRYLIPG
jgi:hypothetical protein